MIIFLHGPDEYRRLQKKKEIIAEFRKKHAGGSIDYFDAAEKDNIIRLRDFSRGQSLFDAKKLAVLENAFSSADGKELSAVVKEAAKSADTAILISEKNKTNEDMPFLSRKSASMQSQDFAYLTGAKWDTFISEAAKESGVALKTDALKFLAEVYQNDTWGLVTEIQKIAGLSRPELVEGGGKTVGLNDLKTLDLEISQDFFGLLKNLKNYALENRLASLEKLFSTNEPMPKIFNMIAYQIPDKLPQLARYDVLVKSGKLDYEEALVDLVL